MKTITLGGEQYSLTEEQAKKIEEVLNQKPKYKRWRAEEYNSYWYYDIGACLGTENFFSADDNYFATGNYFKTREESEVYGKKLILRQRYIDRVAELNEGWNWDIEANPDKHFCIAYDYQNKQFYRAWSNASQLQPKEFLFKSEEIFTQLLEDFTEEELKLILL
jgi:hypothetical protein